MKKNDDLYLKVLLKNPLFTIFSLFLTVSEVCNISNKHWLNNKVAKRLFLRKFPLPYNPPSFRKIIAPFITDVLRKSHSLTRLVFSRFFDIRGNLGNAKEKPFIFPPVHWLKKSDYSSLVITTILLVFRVSDLLTSYLKSNSFTKELLYLSFNSINKLALSITNIHFLPHIYWYPQWVRCVIFQMNSDLLISKQSK